MITIESIADQASGADGYYRAVQAIQEFFNLS